MVLALNLKTKEIKVVEKRTGLFLSQFLKLPKKQHVIYAIVTGRNIKQVRTMKQSIDIELFDPISPQSIRLQRPKWNIRVKDGGGVCVKLRTNMGSPITEQFFSFIWKHADEVFFEASRLIFDYYISLDEIDSGGLGSFNELCEKATGLRKATARDVLRENFFYRE